MLTFYQILKNEVVLSAHPSNVLAQKETIKSQLVGVVFFTGFEIVLPLVFVKSLFYFVVLKIGGLSKFGQ